MIKVKAMSAAVMIAMWLAACGGAAAETEAIAEPEPTPTVDWPETHTYEVHASLREGMPEYRFAATGYETGTGDWGTGYALGLEVFDESGAVILSEDFSWTDDDGTVRGNYIYNQMMDTMGLHVADINFDGYKDVIILYDFGGAHSNSAYRCWLWNSETSSFEEAESFLDIRNPSLDPEGKCIYSTGGSGGVYYFLGDIFEFIGGEFIITHRLDIEYNCFSESELIDGKLEVTREGYWNYFEDQNELDNALEYYRNSGLWQTDNPRWYMTGGHEYDKWIER